MNIKGFKPYRHQRDVIDLILKKGAGSITVVKSSRQKGKSMLLANLLLYFACNKPRTASFCVSPTLKQSRNLFGIITSAAPQGIIVKANAQDLDMTLANGSVISFRSAEQRDSLRGYTCSGILCVDECAFIPDETFYTVLPWCDVHKAPILLVSSPFVRNGFFWDYYNMGLTNTNNVSSVDWSDPKYKDDMDMILPPERLEQYRKALPSNQFRSEYLGEFLDDAGSVFLNFKECVKHNQIKPTDRLFVGIDWAVGNQGDDTVLIALNQDGEEVYQMIINSLSPSAQTRHIVKFLRPYSSQIAVVAPESNSIGNVYIDRMFDEFPDLKPKTKPFTTTNDSKNRIVTQLQTAFENKSISILGTEKELSELSTYAVEYNPRTRNVAYNAPTGLHDDICMALAIAYDAYINSARRGTYQIITTRRY